MTKLQLSEVKALQLVKVYKELFQERDGHDFYSDLKYTLVDEIGRVNEKNPKMAPALGKLLCDTLIWIHKLNLSVEDLLTKELTRLVESVKTDGPDNPDDE